jgi:cobalt-zinc-cadmium efflux system membrane fusion protein
MVVTAGGASAYLATKLPKSAAGNHAEPGKGGQDTPAEEKVKRVGPDAVVLTPDTRAKMGLRTTLVLSPSHFIRLPAFQGVLALDNERLSRVRARFAGEVMDVGRSGDDPSATTVQVGDPVRKGDLLAVVWSKDLGEKKSELVDALSKLKLDQDNLARYRTLTEGVIAAKQIREAEAAVRASEIAVAKAEATLRAWRLGDEEIKAIIAGADKLGTPEARREWARDRTWAKVEVRAPRDGVILEKNVAVGDIVDTTADLFKIGDLTQLAVWVHVHEEDLAILQALPKPVHWTVALAAQPGVSFPGTVGRVGSVIDPVQHTALVSGRVENPDGVLMAGQFVTVTVEAPPSSGEVELPALAVVDDGRESLVFVQPDPKEERFVRRPVQVLRRFRDVVFVRATAGGPVPGNLVATSGGLLLRGAMDQQAVVAAR